MKPKRSTDEPPYNRVMEVAEEYQRQRRKLISGSYSCFGNKVPHTHRNWKHFSRAAKKIKETGASPSEWIAAQFYGATNKQYPYPNNLYSKRSEERYREYLGRQKWPEIIDQQESNLQFFQSRFNMTKEEVVANRMWNFSPWFRALFLSDLDEDIAKDALKSLQSSSLRQALSDKDYDVVDVERKVEAAVI